MPVRLSALLLVLGLIAVTSCSAAPTPPPFAGRDIRVGSVEEIRGAVATARPGDTITVRDGEYVFRPRLEASASGTAERPVTLRGSRAAVLRTKNSSGDYGLWVTGDHWVVQGLTVAHASKGVVLDGSVGTVLDGIEVFDTGQEGVHFRACSSDGVLRRSVVHDTGRRSPQYGEGVYVGSARSNWSRFACADPEEGRPTGDNTERVLVEDNTFTDVPAEGADLKEGMDSGILRRNVFRRVGGSGANSADSAVDVKGNGWVVEDNSVLEPEASWDDDGTARPSAFADGFQTHVVAAGYGTHNVFTHNAVEGRVPGFGVGLYPAADNRVGCDNTAPGAARGLVGDAGRPGTCQP